MDHAHVDSFILHLTMGLAILLCAKRSPLAGQAGTKEGRIARACYAVGMTSFLIPSGAFASF